jgi:hypothetical protein
MNASVVRSERLSAQHTAAPSEPAPAILERSVTHVRIRVDRGEINVCLRVRAAGRAE